MRPTLQRDYIEKKTEDKLLIIENEESFKYFFEKLRKFVKFREKLKTSPSNPSFKRQQTIDEMAEE